MASSKKTKEERRRKREYEARVVVNERQVKRNRRDNIAALVALAVVVVLVTGAQVYYFTGGPGSTAAETSDPATTETAPATPDATEPELDPNVPSADLAEGRSWTGTMTFNDELELGIELDGSSAPQAVSNMIALGEESYFDGTSCHRLTTSGLFVLQCGDPEGTGTGGPGYSWGPVENAPEDGVYPAGTIAMARVGNDGYSMGSQFFIVYEDTELPADSAGGYTVMGQVTSGLDDLVAQIVDEGVEGGATDGAPVAPAVITDLTLE
ncbi:hypothetical protein GCM10011490_04130 [Pseudoclavibacter endophyticus]|uniref:peptidylprolyl isomerase n=1 Tax=Pseudoclavibacter endophyticus TaxID=1778590 RepID=A0A6H9WV44_9MICO|nr:peptidylprolyl isomerase [Pseudoclavibacter endophyticus]KAB1650070.1 peptidylprolyl isomerase [Pseudoclavibacter endophyticus]GGA57521.1 hypothetical protein GCM10011490_04130 [Pseudoclavibacter endophyticus]